MEIEAARRLFPAASDFVWLNHAATSPFATPVAHAMTSMVERLSAGRLEIRQVLNLEDGVRERAARLVGGSAARVAITRNTTHGILLAARGLSWHAGDNVVCANVEFPANVYPWLDLEREGVEVRFAQELEGRIPVEAIERLIDARTRVVALSFVEFTNGYRNDVVAIGRLCRDAGVFFAVDVIQGLGALRFDAAEANADLAAAAAHKWLAGPMGVGIAHLSERAMAEIYPPYVGWRSVVNPEDFLNYDLTLAPDARRFDEGSPNLVGLAGLDAALGLILDVGIGAIERRVLALSDALVAGLGALGCRIASPRRAGERSGIVSFAPPVGGSPALAAYLKSRRIITSVRGDLVRASCHYWNSEDDVASCVAAVEEWIKREARD